MENLKKRKTIIDKRKSVQIPTELHFDWYIHSPLMSRTLFNCLKFKFENKKDCVITDDEFLNDLGGGKKRYNELYELIKESLPTTISKKDWEYVLEKMNKSNREFGFVDFDSNGKIEFYDSDPVFAGVHAMYLSKKHVKEIVESFNTLISKKE